MDSWMNYSSNSSSDDYATAFVHLEPPTPEGSGKAGTTTAKKMGTMATTGTPGSISISNTNNNSSSSKAYDQSDAGYHEDEEVDDDLDDVDGEGAVDDDDGGRNDLDDDDEEEHLQETIVSSKRHRGKDSGAGSKAKPVLPQTFRRKLSSKSKSSSIGGGPGSCSASGTCPYGMADVRMIDFAHTTFEIKNGGTSMCASTNVKVHHGPDSGFLRGLDSLKRILAEICQEH